MTFTKQDTVYNQAEFLNALRSKTLPAHKKLEELPVSASIVSTEITRDEYVHYLELMYAVNADVEQHVFPLLKSKIIDIDERYKAHLIKTDLEVIGSTKPLPDTLPITGKHANLSEAFAMGVMYVIEGSTLGGRVILKNIEPTLKLTEDNGASYFAGYKDNTGKAWKSFLDVLTSYPQNQKDEDEIIAGAEFAFSAIYNHMQ